LKGLILRDRMQTKDVDRRRFIKQSVNLTLKTGGVVLGVGSLVLGYKLTHNNDQKSLLRTEESQKGFIVNTPAQKGTGFEGLTMVTYVAGIVMALANWPEIIDTAVDRFKAHRK
jgi:hypothetical protein